MAAKTILSEPTLTDDSLGYYLKRIGRHKPLNAPEEAKIARRIRRGDRNALEELIKCNLRFVVSVSRNYQNQGLPLADLINEGNIGLIRAAKRFDEKKNFKFISYAVWWIRQSILQALAEQSRIVTLPLNRVGTIHKIGRVQGKLEQKYCRLPNTEEIAEELNLKIDDVMESLRIGNSHISLDAPIQHNDDDSKLMDIIYDNEQELPDDAALRLFQQNEVDGVLNRLKERERRVLKLYFGIGEETQHTLEEIGEHFNLTRERVRQIKERALKRLKHITKSMRQRASAAG
jgi:RNA polymerase primary sigma factor